ncbi:hypothetical protein GVAV_002026 [Gurleya vavrai]
MIIQRKVIILTSASAFTVCFCIAFYLIKDHYNQKKSKENICNEEPENSDDQVSQKFVKITNEEVANNRNISINSQKPDEVIFEKNNNETNNTKENEQKIILNTDDKKNSDGLKKDAVDQNKTITILDANKSQNQNSDENKEYKLNKDLQNQNNEISQ